MINKIVKIYSDGAATMNNVDGKYIRGRGGSAIAVVDKDNNVIYTENKGFDNTTNNYCELYAIFMALAYFHNHNHNRILFTKTLDNYVDYKDLNKDNACERELEIYSDSAYCINMLKSGGWIYSWNKNGWTRGKKHEPIENLEIIKKIWELMQNIKVTFIKVKGHSGNKINELVDKLAVEAKENN